MGKIDIDSDIILEMSPNYPNLPRKAKKKEMKRIVKKITESLNHYIERILKLKQVLAFMIVTGIYLTYEEWRGDS